MKSFQVKGTGEITFFPDDTIQTVRQWVALAVGSHPDKLFIQVKQNFPKDTYADNPKRWTDLFNRLSYDGVKITREVLQVYLTQYRAEPGVTAREITREEWEERSEDLKPLYDPPTDFDEWRCLGVEEAKSMVLPLPPANIVVKPAMIPVPKVQSLFETFHDYEAVTEFRAAVYNAESTPPRAVNLYFPFVEPGLPDTIENLRGPLQESQTQLKNLLALDVPSHQKTSIVRAKWYIPLISTEFTSPRARFEQIFYGMTVNETTPYIGYFTARTETLRHKLFVTDPKTKKTFLEPSLVKGWLNGTLPQRKMPTLLLYRGDARNVFDRIAVTPKDITVTVFRSKESTETLDQLKGGILEWMKTLDALVPFVKMTDLDVSRWDLADLSVLASYSSEVREFDMYRFPCLQTIFGFQNDAFRLLRSEQASSDITPQELQIAQIFQQDDAELTAEYLAQELGVSLDEAGRLFANYQARAEEYDIEKSLRSYPTLKFSNKEVIVKFVTSVERTLKYADILRYVLSAGPDVSIPGCERQLERVAPKLVIPQQEITDDVELDQDPDLLAFLGEQVEEPEPEAQPTVKKSRKIQVSKTKSKTYNYFNARLQVFDPDTFDKDIYPGKCEKKKQVVVLTPEDQARIPQEYNYANVPESEKLELNDPDGVAICPPYWCMRNEIPLREDQLVVGDDGELHCPVCNGKVRTSDGLDTSEYPVIVRDLTAKYPDYLTRNVSGINQRKMPCCYQTPRTQSVVLERKEEDNEFYIQKDDAGTMPAKRMAYLSPSLVTGLGLQTQYETSTAKNRLLTNNGDLFRVGLGRPSKTLPVFLNDTTPILRPKEAEDNVKRCSFFRTWKDTKPGETPIERIINGIDYAFMHGEMSIVDELEYVTTFLRAEVVRVDRKSNEVLCGFPTDVVEARNRMIVMLDDDLLVLVERKKRRGDKVYKTYYDANIQSPTVRELHTRACAVDLPSFSDAIRELQLRSLSQYQVILDPFGRMQALFVPGQVILPIQPITRKPDQGVDPRSGYAEIKQELPTGASQRAFLELAQHPKFKVARALANPSGQVVELELTSGFRVPIQPEEGQAPLGEVWETVQKHTEADLVEAPPNQEDVRIATEITYSEEIYQFLLFTLSKSIQADTDGQVLNEMYGTLRDAIQTRSQNLLKLLKDWFKENAYNDTTQSPVNFVNKVRTPCGQYTQKDACNKSSLCGWTKNTCKIRVKPIVDSQEVLKRMAKTLRDNDKQRALVLDTRLSPFFSTMLYLEMPHELITVSL
jgi:hypothetical protein